MCSPTKIQIESKSNDRKPTSAPLSVSTDHQLPKETLIDPPPEEYMPAKWKCLIAAAILPPLTMAFASWFPFVIPYTHASLYYQATNYVYDAEHTRFDNSALTYVTDYLLAVWMFTGCFDMYRIGRKISKVACSAEGRATGRQWIHLKDVALITSGMLGSYAFSVIFGGLSHQFFITLEMMNTIAFRVMWSITVGLVTAAAGFIGAIGSHFALYFESKVGDAVPIMPLWFWIYFGFYLTMVCWAGGMSFYRPAADIFIAGTAQFCPTMYVVIVIVSRRFSDGKRRSQAQSSRSGDFPDLTKCSDTVSDDNTDSSENSNNSYDVAKDEQRMKKRNIPNMASPLLAERGVNLSVKTAPVRSAIIACFVLGFFLNAPLLPAYPELLWSGLDLGVVNAILHCNLATAWGLQYLSIKWICEAQLSDVAGSH